MEVGLDALGVDVAILTHGGGVPGRLTIGIAPLVAELVLAAGRQELCAERRADLVGELLLPQRRESEHIAGAVLRLELQIVALAVGKLRPTGADIDGSGIAKVAGGLEDGTLLTVVERDLLDVVERELAEVYLTVLCIAQLHAVVADA